ncbi:hypothetical protein D3C75_891210 [compost metagenome]
MLQLVWFLHFLHIRGGIAMQFILPDIIDRFGTEAPFLLINLGQVVLYNGQFYVGSVDRIRGERLHRNQHHLVLQMIIGGRCIQQQVQLFAGAVSQSGFHQFDLSDKLA